MFNGLARRRLILTTALFLMIPAVVHGQDLGSSTGLFRSAKPAAKTPAKTEAKSTVRKKPAATAKKTAPRTSSKSSAAAKQTPASKSIKIEKSVTAPQNAPKADLIKAVAVQPQQNLVITVGERKASNFEELFEQALEQGNAARDEREYAKAEESYRRAFGLKTDYRAVYGLGNVYSDQQRWEEAEAVYRRAIQIDPNAPEPYVALSFVLTQPLVAADLTERYDEAERLARRALEIDPNSAFGHDQLGVAMEIRGNISNETRAAYERAISLEPEFALAYAHLGRLLRKNGLGNESAEAYRKAIAYSTDVPTMILVADVMQSQQRFLESEQLLRRALQEDPRNPTALMMLGRALTTRAVYDEAEKVLLRAVAVSPNTFVVHSLLGSLYLRQSRNNDAEKSLLKALNVVSVNEKRRLAQDFETLGDAYRKEARMTEAARAYKQSLTLDTSRTGIRQKLAKLPK